MYSKEQSTMERSCSSASRASFRTCKRSVPGMKTLMPLKLLSPTLPDFDTWPSLESSKRTTFGTRIVSQDFEEFSEIGDRARDSMISRKRSQQYRDTPIYSQPGSPIPSRAYFSDNDVRFNFSQPGSISDEDGCIHDSVSLQEDKLEDDNHNQNDGEKTPCTVKNVPQRQFVTPTSRWSDLSFQCSGEALFENEAAWLRSPMSKNSSADSTMLAVDARDNLVERIVESWLSDTSSSFEHEDEALSCTTALSPSKAQVIDLRINPNHPSELSLCIPARSSSLMGTSVPENNFWETFGTPPITPAGPWDRDPDLVQKAHSPDYNNNLQLSKHHLDFALPSPPLSPHASPQKRHTQRLSTQEFNIQWPLPPPSLPQLLLTDIVGSLEALTSSFPSTILLSESPCITAIRSRNTPLSPPIQNTTSPPRLRSPFGHEFPCPPSYQPTSKPKKRTFSSHQRDSSSATSSNQPPSHSAPTTRSSSLPLPTLTASLHPPDLSPLERIFPNTSDIMLSSLYGHILAHIFITSLSSSFSSLPSPQYAHPPTNRKARRDTPHWTASPLSPKAANLLGIAILQEDSAEKQLQFRLRIQALQQNLRKCIYCLISVMDENLEIEDMAEFEDSGPGFNNGKLFMRTLEEVVRGCEARNADGML
ncbi:hypothetical protein BDZ45DRAFT_688849 [Acephala macrosclerotiorum]|nr:hypothetical protein BDZ45DRAFT_688849 [Acephala macrosclerotiorum]